MAMKPTAPNPSVPSVLAAPSGFSLKPSKQVATLLGVGIGLCLAAAGGYFGIQQSEAARLDTEIRNKTQQVNDSEKVAKKLDSTEADFQKIQGRIGRLETSVSQADYVPTMLKQVEQLAKSNGLHVDSTRQSFQPAPAPPTDPAQRKTFVEQPYDQEFITLQVKGHYWDIARFMYRLTEFPKILSVEKVDFKPLGDDKSVSPQLQVTFNIVGYIFKPDANLPAPSASPAPGVSLPQVPTVAPTLPPRPQI